ncbi:MAG: DUF5691 domain-containing protein [Ktedonobacterales bacterium]
MATALVGTAQRPNAETSTGTPLDAVTSALAAGEAEWALLLRAGAWAVYTQAGYVAERECPALEPAADETMAACSQGAAMLLDGLLKDGLSQLLPEALERLRRAGLRLPHEILPAALAVRDEGQRAALLPVLGERGRWLSRFNPAWSWVGELLPVADGSMPANAEDIWQEGTTAQRVAILQRLRSSDTAQAREWLEGVWKQEKADVRAELLGTFDVGLSADDGAFLEQALGDRSANVRGLAARLLARIPSSGFAARMRERADGMIMQNARNQHIDAEPPETLPKEWQDDGIVAKPPSGVGERAYWLTQVLALVPPAHWEERFGMAPEQIVAAAAKSEWEGQMVHGWAQATILHNATPWALPLWQRWVEEEQRRKNIPGADAYEMRTTLASLMPANVLVREIRRLMKARMLPKVAGLPYGVWSEVIVAMPAPWSRDFGEFYLSGLRDYARKLTPKSYNDDTWLTTLDTAALALPVECLPDAIEPWTIPEDSTWQVNQARHRIESFVETLRMRQRIVEEIPL